MTLISHHFCTILNINVDFIRLSDLHQNVWQRVSRLPYRVHEREGKKGGLKEGERWHGPPVLFAIK